MCNMESATSFSLVEGEWVFSGDCTRATERYYVPFDRFFNSPESTVDWLAHLHEKKWMDWKDFADMMDRFREATGSFGKL